MKIIKPVFSVLVKLSFFGLFLLLLLVLPVLGYTQFRHYFSATPSSNQESTLADTAKASDILGETTASSESALELNLPTFFNDTVQAKNGLTVDGGLVSTGNITAPNIVYSVKAGAGLSASGTQDITLTNTGVLSFQGKTGDVNFTAGSGITVDGLTISNTGVTSIQGSSGAVTFTNGTGITVDGTTISNSDPGSSQKIFKTVAVSGQSNVVASTNTDTLTFGAGSGIAIVTDPTTNTLTFTSTGASGVGAWQESGGNVTLTTSSDNVGIGTSSPTAKLDVLGAAVISGALTVGGINNTNAGITNAGSITGATGFTTSGALTFSSLSTGILHTNFSGVVSSSALNLAGGTSEITGILPVANGGTGLSTYTTGDLLYASSTNTVGKLAIGSSNQVLTVAGGVPTWTTFAGNNGLCSDCLVTDPGSTQSITPTAATATGLSVRQAAGGNVDIFNVTNNGASSKYFSVDNSGNVIIGAGGGTPGVFTVAPVNTDHILISPVAQGSTSFNGVLTSADLTAGRTWTLPDITGTFCLSTGNCNGSGTNFGGSGTTNFLAKFNGATTVQNSIVYDNATAVGIGNTNPGSTLDVTGTFNASGNGSIGGTLGVTGASNLLSTLDVTGATALHSTLGVTAATTLSSTLDVTGTTTLSNVLHGNGTGSSWFSGNLGIGTTSPTSALTVSQAAISSGGLSSTYGFNLNNASNATLLGLGQDNNYAYVQSFSSKPLQLNNLGNNVYINSGTSGNVAIGSTNPSSKFDVTGFTLNTDADATIGIANFSNSLTKNDTNTRTFYGVNIKPTLNTGASNTNTTYSILNVDTVNTATTGVTTNLLSLNSGGTNRMVVTANGQVGIGTSIPATNAATAQVAIFANNTTAPLQMFNTSNSNNVLYNFSLNSNAAQLRMFNSSAVETIRLGANTTDSYFNGGNLGIGNTAPSTKLDVTGLTLNTDADQKIGSANFTTTVSKNDSNTRTFYGLNVAPTFNTGASNANTTFNALNVDTTNTGVTGLSAVNLLRLAYGGSNRLIFNNNGGFSQISTGATGTLNQIAMNSITSATGYNLASSATAFTGILSQVTLSGSNAANTGTVFRVGNDGASNTGVAAMISNAGSGASLRVNDDGTDTDSTPFMIDASGNVGIGNTAPTTKLDITGLTLNTDADQTVMGQNISGSITKNDTNTRQFYGLNIKPTINAGASNTNTTFNILNVDTTSTSTTGMTTNLMKLSDAGTARLTVVSSGNLTSTSATVTGTGATFNENGIQSGIGMAVNANSITSGTGFNLASTSTAFTTGNLALVDWSPGSATSATGDLLRLNVGSNGTIGNLLNIVNGGTSIFSVSQAQATVGVPTAFTASGDLGVANDIQLTNQTAANIKSLAPLTIETGESFESNDLTLRTFNSGNVVFDAPAGLVQSPAIPATASSTNYLFNMQPTLSGTLNTAQTAMYGIYSVPIVNLTSGSSNTLTTLYGGYTGLTATAGTITTWYGNYIAAPTGSGTVSNKFAFVSESGAGNVGIGTTAPGAALEVNGNIFFTKETARTLQIADTVTSNTAGAALTVKGAAGVGSGQGGDIAIQGGASGSSNSNRSGNITIGGVSRGNGQRAGSVTIAGDSAGTNASGNGGDVNITGGAQGAQAASGNGGSIILTAGNEGAASSGGTGGLITMTAGVGNATSAGGAISLTTGNGGSTSGSSGALTLGTGTITSGSFGTISMKQGANTRMFFDANGQVGIGNTAPTTVLDLTGKTLNTDADATIGMANFTSTLSKNDTNTRTFYGVQIAPTINTNSTNTTTTFNALNVGTTETSTTGTTINLLRLASGATQRLAVTSGGNFNFSTGAVASNGINLVANSLTGGNGMTVNSTATAMTGNIGLFSLTGNNAANTGQVLKVEATGASTGATTLMVSNAGTGSSFRVNDDGTDTDSTPFYIDSAGNTIIGGTSNTGSALLDVKGTVRVGTIAGGPSSNTLCFDGNNIIISCASSERFKHNIQSMGSTLDRIMNLHPVTFNWNANDAASEGLIAEQVDTVDPLLVARDGSGTIQGVRYDYLAAVLTKGIQEQQGQINLLNSKVTGQQGPIIPTSIATFQSEAEKRLTALEGQTASLSAQLASLTNTPVNNSASEASQSAMLADLSRRIDDIHSEATPSGMLDQLASRVDFLEKMTFQNTASGAAVLGAQTSASGSASLISNLTVMDKATLNDVGITGTFTDGLIAIDGVNSTINALGSTLKLQNGTVEIETKGNLIATGEVTAKKINIDKVDPVSASIGKATLKAGTTSVIVTTTAVTASSDIFVTPQSKTTSPLYVLKQIDKTSFEVDVASAQATDVIFKWWIVN